MLFMVIERFKHGNPRLVGDRFRFSAKHPAAYLDEMTFRFDNRENSYLFRYTLIKLLEAPVLEYKKLTADAA
jgi:hypothetical protein